MSLTATRSRPAKTPHLGKAERPQALAIEIDKAQAAAARHHAGRQRIVAEARAAEMRRDGADVRDGIDLDPQQHEPHTVRARELEWHLREPQEAGRVARLAEAVDECGLDQIEVGLGRLPWVGGRVVAMRHMPLHWLAAGNDVVVPWACGRQSAAA